MKTALLIIDVQRGLFDKEPRPFEADAVIERINALSGRFRAARAPVVVIQHERKDSPFAYGTAAWALETQLVAAPTDHYVRKSTPDAFLRTDLQSLLQSLDVTHVVVCGYASEFCIDTTTRRAAALGYTVTVAADAHTTHDKEHAPAAAIRAHENATLPNITSFGPVIRAKPSAQIAIAG